MFIAILFTVVKIWKQSKCPSADEWIKKMGVCIYTCTYIHTYNGIYSAIEKNEILPFATPWMDLHGIILSEISKTEKDKYCVISLICAT